MNFFMTGQEKGDLLIEMTVQAALTVYTLLDLRHNHLEKPVKHRKLQHQNSLSVVIVYLVILGFLDLYPEKKI